MRAVLSDGEACWIEGNATPFGMYAKLYRHRDQFVVIDDVDALYADRSGVRLLKCLCQTEEEKAVAWHSDARSLERQRIPREFTTKSRVVIISNDWQTLNKNVAALQDRGHVIFFQPSASEVHAQAGKWFEDEEIYGWFATNLHRVREPSLRHYVRAKELKAAGMTQELIESMIDLDWPTTGQLTSYHEASHAIAAVAFGIGFNYVSVVAGHDVLGGVAFDERPPALPLGFDPNNPDHLWLAENRIVLAFAGEAADAYRTGRDFDMRWPEAKGDLLVALAAASRLHANRGERHAVLNEMASRACPFVREPLRKDQIEAVARRLRMASELSREQVEWIMDNAADVSHGYLESESETGVDCRPGQDVPVIIEGREVGRIAVADVLP